MEYFEARSVGGESYSEAKLPHYFKEVLENLPQNARILDFGCGFGQILYAIKTRNFAWDSRESLDSRESGADSCADSRESKNSPSLAEGDLGGGLESKNNESLQDSHKSCADSYNNGGGGNPKNPPRFELFGIDINPRAIEFCKNRGLNAQKIDDIFSFKPQNECEKFDLIISTHCLEHIEKARVVPLLAHFREHLLREGGAVFIAVPNAQSFTNCYWVYEDFTHEGLFTAGSLIFVLKMAGFKSVEMIDLDALCGSRGVKKLVRKAFLKLYKINAKFWCKITASAYHAPSPVSYAYEIKALARK